MNLAHQLASLFIFSPIFSALLLKFAVLLLISIPSIVADSFISKPMLRIPCGIGAMCPTGIKTVFSMLQRSPDNIPKLSSISLIRCRLLWSISTRQFASSAMASTLEQVAPTSGPGTGKTGGAGFPGGLSAVPNICKSKFSLKSSI